MMRLRVLSLLAKLFRPKGGAPEDALGIDWIALEPPVITRTLSPGEIPIGRLDSRCPNCGVVLVKRPRGKTRCRSCQKYIWVRWNTEGQQVLLSEEMLKPFNRQKYGDDETNKAVESISVDPELTPKMRATITKMLTDFLLQNGEAIPAARIPAMQQQIQASIFAGDRADGLATMLQNDYGLAQHLAARVAAQADSLLVSKWRELRARDAGCTRYKWSTSHDERVCPRCRALQGRSSLGTTRPKAVTRASVNAGGLYALTTRRCPLADWIPGVRIVRWSCQGVREARQCAGAAKKAFG